MSPNAVQKSLPIYLMFIRVLLSVELCFILKTYLKGGALL
jgi:hypothetical protein